MSTHRFNHRGNFRRRIYGSNLGERALLTSVESLAGVCVAKSAPAPGGARSDIRKSCAMCMMWQQVRYMVEEARVRAC